MAVRYRVCGPTQCGITALPQRCTKGGCELDGGQRTAGSRLKLPTIQEGAAWKANLPAVVGKTRRTE